MSALSRAGACAGLVALLAFSAPAAGAPAPVPPEGILTSLSLSRGAGPVEIEAAEVEVDYRTRELWYRGGVRVRQGNVELQAERLHVRLDDTARPQVVEVAAEGGVVVRQGDRIATGERALFDRSREVVELRGDARLRQGKNEVRGERVVVYLGERRSVVEGGAGRVRALLFPAAGEAAAPAASPSPGHSPASEEEMR